LESLAGWLRQKRGFQPRVSDSEPRDLFPDPFRLGPNPITKNIPYGNYTTGVPLVGPLIQMAVSSFRIKIWFV
jgi:hypothetical protein